MIGIVGATGAVGRAAAKAMHGWGYTELRLGGRRKDALDELALALPGASAAPVDVFDAAELAGFCRGCDVVLNCAGPAHEVGDQVARAGLANGADYVDAAGDDVLFQQVARIRPARPAVAMVSAGMMPGLTALLPRYLVQMTPGAARALAGYVGGRDRFTVTAAADYFRGSSSFGTARMVLRGGMRVPAPPGVAAGMPAVTSGRGHAALASSGARATASGGERAAGGLLPFFAEPATTMAFLSTEIERICSRLGIAEASWYSVFAGEHVAAAIRGPSTPEELARAAALDSFGRQTYQLIVIELATQAQTRTLVLRGTGASALTGEFAALSADAVARHRIPAGVHHAGEILDPSDAVARLRGSACVAELAVLDGDAHETGSYVEEII